MSDVTPGDEVGARIKRLRKRAGYTQAAFGEMISRSQAWVSEVESGFRELDSIALIRQVAQALRVHPNDITGQTHGLHTDAEQRATASLQELRRAVQRFDLAPDWPTDPRGLAELAGAVQGLVTLRRSARYADLGAAVPGVIREIHAAAHAATGTTAESYFALLAAAYKEADTVAHTLGADDLATLAIERFRWAAVRAADPGLEAVGDFLRIRDLWSLSLWGDALSVIDTRLEALRGSTGPAATAVGGLHLRAAITAARAMNVQEARSRIVEARDHLVLVDGVGDPYGLTFTPANVAIHAVSVEVEAGYGAEAVALADVTRLPEGTPRSRAARYKLDVARGCMLHGLREKGLSALVTAEKLAPLMVRNNAGARAITLQLLQGRGAADERLRLLAGRMRLT